MKIDTEPRKNELLSHCSPEFQEQVKREQESKEKAVEKERVRQLRLKSLHESAKNILVLFLIGAAFALLYGGHTALDKAGWVAHNHDTPVWIKGDWQVGEYRVCDMFVKSPRLFCGMDNKQGLSMFQFPENVTDDDLAKALGAVTAEVTPNAKTDWSSLEGYFHVLPVKYFGRLERPGKWRITWRCQRNSDSLTCKALD